MSMTTWETQVKARIATTIKEARESGKNGRTDDLAEDIFEALMGEGMIVKGPGDVVRHEFDVPGAPALQGPVCECCGTAENVRADLDPYLLEIYGERNIVALCAHCHRERLWDI